jgi:uncharacterized protein with HEPN domain
MRERPPKLLIGDMLDCVNKILLYTLNFSSEQFLKTSIVKDAVLRNLEVLGEAANKVPQEFKKQHEEIEWGKIIRSRNVVIHEYQSVDFNIVWTIVTVHIPPLKASLEKILKSL